MNSEIAYYEKQISKELFPWATSHGKQKVMYNSCIQKRKKKLKQSLNAVYIYHGPLHFRT